MTTIMTPKTRLGRGDREQDRIDHLKPEEVDGQKKRNTESHQALCRNKLGGIVYGLFVEQPLLLDDYFEHDGIVDLFHRNRRTY